MAERRRLERDLHDGAQQRLVALSLQLGLARSAGCRRPRRPPRSCSTRAREELRHALEELRELARGIHPAILTDRGLDAGAARRSPTARRCRSSSPTRPRERLPAAVEAAAYFVVAESLTNVAKYAARPARDASRVAARQRLRRRRGPRRRRRRRRPAGAAPACAASPTAWRRSTGAWRSIARPGEGTVVRAKIPCASVARRRQPCCCARASRGCSRTRASRSSPRPATPRTCCARSARTSPTSRSSTCACRRRTPTRACARRREIRAALPRHRRARALAVRRGALRARAAVRQRRGRRLPAQGPRRRRRRASSTPCGASGRAARALDPEVVSRLLGRRRREDPLDGAHARASARCSG